MKNEMQQQTFLKVLYCSTARRGLGAGRFCIPASVWTATHCRDTAVLMLRGVQVHCDGSQRCPNTPLSCPAPPVSSHRAVPGTAASVRTPWQPFIPGTLDPLDLDPYQRSHSMWAQTTGNSQQRNRIEAADCLRATQSVDIGVGRDRHWHLRGSSITNTS